MIKSTINDNACTPVYPFPKLMIHKDGLVVLFEESKRGMALDSDISMSAGDYSSNWVMDNFTDFKGTIQLENGA